jgi:hypothetical protein
MNNCSETRCTLREKCQRFNEAGDHKPIMPFFPGGEKPDDWESYIGPLAGCPDYWPIGTGPEWFLNEIKKTVTS